MKRLIGNLALLGIASLLLYAFISPALTWNALTQAIRAQDHEALSNTVDIPQLRANLKEQFNSSLLQQLAQSDNPLGAGVVGISLVSALSESMADVCVTPFGLGALSQGERPTQLHTLLAPLFAPDLVTETPSDSAPSDVPEAGTPASVNSTTADESTTRHSFDSISRFSIWVRSAKSSDTRFVFARRGLSWRLANITMPLSDDIHSLRRRQTEIAQHNAIAANVEFDKRRAVILDALQKKTNRDATILAQAPPSRSTSDIGVVHDSPINSAAKTTESPPRVRRTPGAHKSNSAVTSSNSMVMAQHASQIRTAVESQFNSHGLPPDLHCVLSIQIATDGQVLSARITTSSGHDDFDRRATLAVFQASPLPVPKDPELAAKFSDIRLAFAP